MHLSYQKEEIHTGSMTSSEQQRKFSTKNSKTVVYEESRSNRTAPNVIDLHLEKMLYASKLKALNQSDFRHLDHSLSVLLPTAGTQLPASLTPKGHAQL